MAGVTRRMLTELERLRVLAMAEEHLPGYRLEYQAGGGKERPESRLHVCAGGGIRAARYQEMAAGALWCAACEECRQAWI